MPRWALPPLPARFLDGHPSFVGRRRELDRLEEVWNSIERGARQAVFIGGEPGSGKTRLAVEFARAIHAREAAVLLGTTSPDLGHPYQPMVEALEHLLVSTPEGSLDGLLPDNVDELLRITPHVKRHRPGLVAPAPADQDRRLELFDAYGALLVAAARERPLALVLEDMHWSNAPTLLLLSHLIRSTADVPLLIVATMRNTPPDRSEELTFLMADLYPLPGVTRIDLAGLESTEIEDYLRLDGNLAHEHVRQTATVLRDQTGGNPFFIRELWRQMSQSGGFQAVRSGHFTPPPTVIDALQSRIRSFAERERSILEMAAVAGDVFDVREVATAEDRDIADVLEGLDVAVEYGLVRPDPGTNSFIFQHALVRHALLAGISPSRSARMHLRLAKLLEPRYPVESALAERLARLYAGAAALDDDDKAVFYLAEAARNAEIGLAHEEAAQLWERTARLMPRDRPEREKALLASAHRHMLGGSFPDARRLYAEVYGSEDPRVSLQAAVGFENASWRPGHHGREALEMLVQALRGIEADPSDPLYVQALTAMGRALAFTGDIRQAGAVGARAVAMAREIGDERLLAQALSAGLLRGMTFPGANAFDLQRATELREIAVRTGDYDSLGPAGAYRSFASYMSGDIAGWYAGWEDIRLATAKTGQPFWEWVVGCYEHCHHFMRGDFSAAEATAERIRGLGYGFGTDDTEGPYGLQMFLVRRETANLDAVRPLISENPSQEGTWLPGLLALYTELGFAIPARKLLWELLANVTETDRREAAWPAVLVFLTEAAVSLRDVEAAEVIRPLMGEYEGYNLIAGQSVAVFGSSHRYLAQLSAVSGDRAGADEHFREALARDEETGSLVHQSETLARWAVMLQRSGDDRDAAADLHARAQQLAASIGHQRVLRLLQSPRDFGLPDGLTPREVDVLRLLAQGASNKEIGDRLFISQNTAANHVRSILMKTATTNRTQAAIYAADKGLVN